MQIECMCWLAERARLGQLVASILGDTRRISRAIGRLREHYEEPLKIEEIARELGMSVYRLSPS